MKWKNKGNEFDSLAKGFTQNRKIFIYGAGYMGKYLYEKLKPFGCVEGFIDNDKKLQNKKLFDRRIMSIEDYVTKVKKKCIVIFAPNNIGTEFDFRDQLLKQGYISGVDIFSWREFITTYLPIYLIYSYQKVFISTVSLIMTTECNLNCKDCLNFTYANKNKRHFSVEKILDDIDKFFQKVDYVDLFHLCGGEPFMYPEFEKIVEYVGCHYRKKMNVLGTTTNGTIIPRNTLLSAFKKNEVTVYLDDYRKNVDLARKNFNTVESLLKKEKVNYILQQPKNWFSLKNDKIIDNVDELISHFDCCNIPYVSLHDGKVYKCNYADYATEAGIREECENDYFILDNVSERRNKEFIEFTLGYSDNGYCDYCKQCAGFLSINIPSLEVAEQF